MSRLTLTSIAYGHPCGLPNRKYRGQNFNPPFRNSLRSQGPGLRLAAPHDEIIITPPRMPVAASRVHRWMTGLPNPHLPENGTDGITGHMGEADTILQDLQSEEGKERKTLRWDVRSGLSGKCEMVG
jgi:hypothetical protein